jgi:hypothetical protein
VLGLVWKKQISSPSQSLLAVQGQELGVEVTRMQADARQIRKTTA